MPLEPPAHDPAKLSALRPAPRPPTSDRRVSLDKFPGLVFQLFRSVEGAWSIPFAGADLADLFRTSAAALAAGADALSTYIPADDWARLKQAANDSFEFGQLLKLRFRVLRADDRDCWMEITAAPELSFSGGTLWHGFLVDVSADHRATRDLRQLHRRWTLAARAAGIGVLEFDIGTETLSLDSIACGHHGIDAEQARLPLPDWLERIAADDRLVAHTALVSAPLDGFAECLLLRLAEPSSETRTLELMFQAVSDEGRLVGTCRDVTQRQTLDALRSEKLAAEKANRSKSEFMSRVSHELRTPLNGILGFVQLMALDQQHPLPPAQMRRVDVLQQSGSRLLGLIDQLLDVSRIDEGRISLRPKNVDAAPLIDSCVAAVFPMASARGVQVTTDIAAGAAPLHIDPQAFEQVLSNLLSNAIKYNRPNGRVRVRLDTREGGRVIIDDTGIGMTEAQLGMLFEPFNRLGAERSAVAGSGLGLVITKKLVHAMGGTLEVQSLVGRGSRFEMRLPVADRGRAELDPAPAPARALPSEWGSDMPQLVLYVEDDDVNTILMEQVFLSQPAWHLLTAATGADGLRMAMEHLPAVVLLDLHLPDMSGLEVLERLRAEPRTRRIPCIAVSADAQADQIERALSRGFDRYWTKPLDLARVIGDLKTVFLAAAP